MKVNTALFLAAFVLLPGILPGQSTTTAVLSGTIVDASGAVVPGAKAIATNPETNLTRESSSDDRGEYRFRLLPPGTYEVRIEKSGFAVPTRKIAVTVGQDAVLDFPLDVGAATQLVEVNSEVPAIEVERTQQSNTINQQDVRNLPISRRDYLSFTLLAPGVNDSRALADSTSFRVKQTRTACSPWFFSAAAAALRNASSICPRPRSISRLCL